MSRIRVYELAKEAGMSSKALTDKLIEAGYDIKGHSSSVDDDAAEKIRNTILKSANTELVEKRIDSEKNRPTVIRRRATVIRRPAKEPADVSDDTSPEAAPGDRAGAAAGPVPEETAEKAAPAKVAADAEKVEPAVVKPGSPDDDKPVRQKVEVVAEDESPGPEAAAPPEPAGDDGAAAGGAGQESAGETVIEEPPAQGEETGREVEISADQEEETKPAKKPKKETKVVKKKPMARVLRVIELPDTDEPAQARGKKKGAKPVARKKNVVESVDDQILSSPTEDGGRARKKGKKGSRPFEDDDLAAKRGGKKTQKSVKFTHFAQDYQGREGKRRGKRGRKQPKVVTPPSEMRAIKKRFKVYDTISVGDLAQRMKVKAGDVIAKLMGLGVMATINQTVDVETAMLIATDFGYEVEQGITEEIGMQLLAESEEGGVQKPRSPVVTVMGHVDHGKTSILDAIRKTDVADGEAGGITQHIGAYHVRSGAGDVTFVDTPGHAAFTEMRSRGAQVTDIVVLVVAADDGVMDQTREAIHHAQAADVPIIVAVNKIDKDNADPDRVKRELSDLDLMPEDWGGQTMYCETSAKKNIGIDNLLESIQLLAEILELKADSSRKARGRVIEAQLHKGRGAVATVLVQDGTLHLGEYFVVGQFSGKVRAMLDDKGRIIKEAGPSMPVEVQGLSGVPSAGDEFIVVTDEKMARNVSQVRSLKARETELGANSKISLDKLFEQMSQGDTQELKVVLRADVQGTLEAFGKAAEDLSTDQIKVKILHEGTGTITESDILLASASDAIIIGFNVRPSVKVKELAVQESVDVRSYDVIYHALDDIRKAMVGMLEPTFEEEVIGLAEVRETFSVPKIGKIAGCAVIDGKIMRTAKVRVLRDGVVIYTGKIDSLRRFKDDVKEVSSGYECGIGVEKFNDIKIGDNLEAFIMNEVEATL
jgi:translation initiation factor IF-2